MPSRACRKLSITIKDFYLGAEVRSSGLQAATGRDTCRSPPWLVPTADERVHESRVKVQPYGFYFSDNEP